MMEFQELKVLVAVVDQGGFLKASKVLHLTQSAVSQALANLERKVGEKLVERTAPVRPTAIGLELLRHARFILERERDFSHDLIKLRQGRLQTLSLTVDFLVNEYYCQPAIEKTLGKFPEVSFKIKRLPPREMVPAVRFGQYALGFGPFQKDMQGLKCHRLWQEVSYLVTGKSNRHLKTYRESPMEFMNETVLLASSLDEPALRPSKTKIRDYFKSAWEVDTLNLQLRLVASGVGATYVPKTILNQNPIAKGFVILAEIPFHKVEKPYGIYHREADVLSEPAKAFKQSCL